MTFETYQLLLPGTALLLLLFAIAFSAERGWLPGHLLRHPAVYVLSLGVIGGAFAVYGSVGLAYEYGYGFLSFYVGIAGTFLFAPLILLPLLRVTRLYQLKSLADLLTFRFRSQWAGSVVTLCMLLAILPLLALQIQAVSDSVMLLQGDARPLQTGNAGPNGLALLFCLIAIAFTVVFGSRQRPPQQRHTGLVAAIAFTSVGILGVLLTLGGVALFGVFDGPAQLEAWLAQQPDVLGLLSAPMRQDSARSLLLIFFAAAVCAPHLFHMLFAENPERNALRTASWGMPLLLMLMSLPVLPILWAGFRLESDLPPDYFALGIGLALDAPWLVLSVFLAGLGAAIAAIVVTTLAMASMSLNHLILPFYQPGTNRDIYRWLLWIRRLLIGAIILAGYLFHWLLGGRETLSSLAMTSFIASLQFLPGVMAVLYWPRANRIGFLAGLIAGFSVWFATLLLPVVSELHPDMLFNQRISLGPLDDLWSSSTVLSLAANTLVFVLVSLLTTTSDEERAAAEVCALDDLNRPTRRTLSIHSPREMKERLVAALGEASAGREVDRALTDLKLQADERRPYALRRLRDRIETNLSGLMGPSVAHDIVNRLLPYDQPGAEAREDINLIEARLERYKYHLTGLAADLDSLRRHHRQTLEDLPIGLCTLGRDREILMWNHAMSELTGIDGRDVVGSHSGNLPYPWRLVLNDFVNSPEPHWHKRRVDVAGSARWISLHKASAGHADNRHDGQVIVVEDITDNQLLEAELIHSERLASIGRLAAGVAHEIGNPVTGIACLAQNLRYDTDNPDSLATAADILQQTRRISSIVQTLVNFAHAGAEAGRRQRQPVDLARCVADAVSLLDLNKEAKPVRFESHCPAGLTVLADEQRLQQVFVNLLSNARDASPEDGQIRIDARPEGNRVHVTVTDQGSGISREHLEQVFEPFFTTKEAGQGTGLGLALVYSIVEDLGGEIDLESPLPGHSHGTRAHVHLRAAASDAGKARADTVC